VQFSELICFSLFCLFLWSFGVVILCDMYICVYAICALCM
jgi:hypothetical protein